MKKWTVYKHTCPKGKVYIGVTSSKLQHRWKGGNGYNNNIYFFRAIKKYGWDNFLHEVLADNLTKSEAAKMEIELIKQYNSTDWRKGYNREPGGNLRSKETTLKISKALMGKKLSKEHIEKIRASKVGVPLKESAKQKLSVSHKKNPKVLNHIISLNKNRKGSPKTEDHRRKIAENQPARRAVINLTTGAKFDSLQDASKAYNVQRSNISKVCIGERETAGGYKWAYVEEKVA